MSNRLTLRQLESFLWETADILRGSMEEKTAEQAREVVQSLVQMLDEATRIVDFFDKWNEKKRVRREIKR